MPNEKETVEEKIVKALEDEEEAKLQGTFINVPNSNSIRTFMDNAAKAWRTANGVILILLLLIPLSGVVSASERWPQLSKPKPYSVGIGERLRTQRERVRAKYERQKTREYSVTNNRTGRTTKYKVAQ